jgi:hypothetical protein
LDVGTKAGIGRKDGRQTEGRERWMKEGKDKEGEEWEIRV